MEQGGQCVCSLLEQKAELTWSLQTGMGEKCVIQVSGCILSAGRHVDLLQERCQYLCDSGCNLTALD